MSEASIDKVEAKYAQQYRALKQLLLAKHFTGEGQTLCCCGSTVFSSHNESKTCNEIHAGQRGQENVTVDGLEISFSDEPPLKKFVTPPKLSEDLAK